MNKLDVLYSATSKHSQYQSLHPRISGLMQVEHLAIRSRNEVERFAYISDAVNFKERTVCDVGGNTGYFSFAALEAGAKEVVYIEGNIPHSRFVSAAREALRERRLEIYDSHIDFPKGSIPRTVDVLLLLNVLHHIGDDFGNKGISRAEALEMIAESLRVLAGKCKILVFQLGYNWKGDKHQCLFPNGSKREMVRFVEEAVRGDWFVKHIGIAQEVRGNIRYADLSADNIERDDRLGEFLNRPIFILEPTSCDDRIVPY